MGSEFAVHYRKFLSVKMTKSIYLLGVLCNTMLKERRVILFFCVRVTTRGKDIKKCPKVLRTRLQAFFRSYYPSFPNVYASYVQS